MSHGSLFSRLRRSLALALGAARRGVPVAEHVERAHAAAAVTRRELIQRAALGVGALALAGRALPGCADDKTATSKGPTVAIVGAGMAGLLCGWRLRQAGVAAAIYDANNRVGGRMFSARGRMADGQVIELGGELIDTQHVTLHRVAAELGIVLDDLFTIAGEAGLTKDLFYFGGQLRSDVEVVAAWQKVVGQLASDAAAAETDAGIARLDAMSLADYLASLNDLEPWFHDFLEVAYIIEYGLPLEQQSALNLVWLLDTSDPEHFEVFGVSDERFHAHGGNDRFIGILAEKLASQIELDHRLVAMTKTSGGRWRLTFGVHATTHEVTVDHVVLTLPWTMLRQVEVTPPWPEPKGQMIRELGYGTNSKVMLQFRDRVWHRQGSSGGLFTDTGPQNVWDTTRGQSGAAGILTVYTGGPEGLAAAEGTPDQRARLYLPQMEPVFPGLTESYIAGSAQRWVWAQSDLFLGSYACYKPGQAAWSGLEIERVGNVHFCGEQTSADFQGYMEGAAETGEAAAAEILADLALA